MAAEGFLWTATVDGPTLVRIDPGTGAIRKYVLGSGSLAFGPAIAYAANSLWVIVEDGIVRFDPATSTVSATVAAGSGVYDVAAAPDGLWLSRPDDGTVSRVDTRTNRIRPVYDMPGEPKELLVDRKVVWVASHTDGGIRSVEIATGRVLATVEGLGQPRNMIRGHDSLWVADLDGRVIRVDTAAAEIQSAIPVPVGAFGILSTSGSVLTSGIADGGGGVVIQVDPVTGQATGQKKVGVAHLGELICVGGDLWVPDIEGGNVIEIHEPACG